MIGDNAHWVKLDPDTGNIVMSGTMERAHLDEMIARGEPYTIVDAPLDFAAEAEHHYVSKGRVRKKPKGRVEKERADRDAAQLAAMPYNERRMMQYPPLYEFAEALVERELGDDAKWQAYVERCKAIRAAHPKS